MISQMAIEDMDEMMAKGLRLVPSDVIRLNALGLRVQFSRMSEDLSVLPRVAILGDLSFREPTVGHEIWMHDVEGYFDLSKVVTSITVRAFCLSRSNEDLPDPAEVSVVVKSVRRFQRKDMAPFTLSQIAAALVYAERGNDPSYGERVKARNDAKDLPEVHGDKSFEAGILYQGVVIGLGTFQELRGLTVSKLVQLLREKIRRDERFGFYAREWQNDAMADYLRAKDEIEERLKVDSKCVHDADDDAAKGDDEPNRERDVV